MCLTAFEFATYQISSSRFLIQFALYRFSACQMCVIVVQSSDIELGLIDLIYFDRRIPSDLLQLLFLLDKMALKEGRHAGYSSLCPSLHIPRNAKLKYDP